MIYEILDGDTVINTINASPEFAEAHYPGAYRKVADPAPAATTLNTKITRLAYLNRLGPKLETIYILAQANVSVQIYRDKVLASECVDLADELTIKGINDMVSAGIYTAAEGDEILTAPVTDREAFKG